MRDPIPTDRLTVGQQVGVIGAHFGGDVTIIDLGARRYGIGTAYSYPQMTVRLPSGEQTTIDSLAHTFLTAEYRRDEWCPHCRTASEAIDEFPHSWYEPDGEHETRVVQLACGHDVQHGEQRVGPAPGAPYAGPGAVVAASTRLADRLEASHRIAAEFDPWADR